MPETLVYENRFGRRQTRGLRPWLLVPKVIALAVYFGGLVTLLVLWMTPGFARRLFYLVDITRLLTLRAIVPALLLAMLLGIALFLQHPRQFIRMRWLQLKLAILLVFVPSAHLFMSSRLEEMRQLELVELRLSHDGTAVTQFQFGLMAVVLVSGMLIILGRLKPRLGQNWARRHAATSRATSSRP